MKEFKFCGEMTEYVEIPVYVCETQKEMVKEISEIRDVLTFVDEARENLLDTAVSNEEETSVYIIYKDGSIYFKTLDEEEGKFKRYGIKAAVIETAYEYTVFGDFAVTDNGDISIEESEIEEYGVYAGQYDVKEQDEQEVQEAVEQTETETNETTDETETEETVEQAAEQETVEGISKMETTTGTDDSGFEYYSVETAYEVDFRDRQNEVFKTYSEAEKTAGDNIILEVDLIVRNDKKAVSEHDKEVFEDETDEIECRCIWYHHNGVKGMIAQDTKRVIKKPETAEVSKEVKEQFEKQKTSFKFYDVSIAYQVERYVNCGSLKYVQLGTYSDYAKAVKAAQEAIENWGEENIYFHTVEFAKRSSEPIKNNKKVFKSETHEIDYYWISARLTDTKECGYVNIDSPIRIPIETSEQSETVEQTEVEKTAETETEETIKTTAERQKDEVIIMMNKEMQTAVENWYMNGKPSSSYFTMNGEKYAVLPRYGTSSNEFDVFKVKTFTIGEGTYHYPYYDPETREPIDRIAVVTIPDELIEKKEAQIAEDENNNALFEDFFKEV